MINLSTHRKNSFPRSRESGFTLIELMISMLLGLIMIAGTISVLAGSKRAYNTTEALSRLQENARFAIGTLTRDIRMAGYMGCAGSGATITNTLNNATDYAFKFSQPIEGFEAKNGSWNPTIEATIAGPLVGNDVITVRTVLGSSTKISQHPGALPAPGSADLKVAAGHSLDDEDIILVTDCSSAAIFQITHINTSGTEHNIVHNTGNSVTPGNATKKLGKSYKDGELLTLSTLTYYIRTSAAGQPALWRRQGSQAAEEWVEGVEQMQIRYGVDTNQDQVIDQYVKANNVADWSQVISVNVNLLLATVSDRITDLPQTLTFDGQFIEPNDRRLRKVFSTNVSLRNRAG